MDGWDSIMGFNCANSSICGNNSIWEYHTVGRISSRLCTTGESKIHGPFFYISYGVVEVPANMVMMCFLVLVNTLRWPAAKVIWISSFVAIGLCTTAEVLTSVCAGHMVGFFDPISYFGLLCTTGGYIYSICAGLQFTTHDCRLCTTVGYVCSFCADIPLWDHYYSYDNCLQLLNCFDYAPNCFWLELFGSIGSWEISYMVFILLKGCTSCIDDENEWKFSQNLVSGYFVVGFDSMGLGFVGIMDSFGYRGLLVFVAWMFPGCCLNWFFCCLDWKLLGCFNWTFAAYSHSVVLLFCSVGVNGASEAMVIVSAMKGIIKNLKHCIFASDPVGMDGQDSGENKQSTADMTQFVQTLLQQMMGDRINELEQSINDLRTEMGADGSPSPLSTSKKPDEPKSEEGSA
ncbi:hypothetical protein CTI12_AA428010 [Artemisia annua]|uniref:Uncharacterized protein n=1 Tax=Artemisia annua TaxID=35608 RepID=A0A2U1LUK1_ARTAN|nr:hypothetical protein CTI12_AA428010 [Artemisia annua]